MSINFHIKTKEHDLTPDLSAEVHEKLAIIEKHIDTTGDKEALAEVELGLESRHHSKGDIYRAEINLTHAGQQYRAVAKKSSREEALDAIRDEITHQIERRKGKQENLFLRGARKIKGMLKR